MLQYAELDAQFAPVVAIQACIEKKVDIAAHIL
jgi:hypothetical protein